MYSQRIPEPFQCYTRRNKYLSSDTVLSRRLIPHLESFFFFPFLNQSLDAWGWCTGTTQRDGTGRKEGSGWGTRVCLWWIHVDIWQNQYNIVKLKNKIKKKRKRSKDKKKKFDTNVCDWLYLYLDLG